MVAIMCQVSYIKCMELIALMIAVHWRKIIAVIALVYVIEAVKSLFA